MRQAASGHHGAELVRQDLLGSVAGVGSWEKVCVVDTENNSAHVYARVVIGV